MAHTQPHEHVSILDLGEVDDLPLSDNDITLAIDGDRHAHHPGLLAQISERVGSPLVSQRVGGKSYLSLLVRHSNGELRMLWSTPLPVEHASQGGLCLVDHPPHYGSCEGTNR